MNDRKILEDAESHDGVEPMGEAFVNRLDSAVRANIDGQCVGIAVEHEGVTEVAVHPAYRRRGVGTKLLDEIDAKKIWAHGNLRAAQVIAEKRGLTAVRTLLQMSIEDIPTELENAPEGVVLETYPEAVDRLGAQEIDGQWLAVNNEAFDWHPEQGGWTPEDLNQAREADWFDPEGVLFAVEKGRIVGFHWTKVHGPELGEVYVIGLSRLSQGRGIGGWLTRAGLVHLASKGVKTVILYVEGDNVAAVRTYKSLGFEVSREDVLYG